ncbi:MAG: DUF1737 domain-containing protein [Angustibacter sp.]
MTDHAVQDRLAYRLLTGPDDRSFCEKISAALAEGYVLYGSPSVTTVDGALVAAQAVVLPRVARVVSS